MSEAQIYVLIALTAAHFLGDFLFQTDALAARKKIFRVLLLHSSIVALLSYLLCGDWANWTIPLLIFLSHALIDYAKSTTPHNKLWVFLADQVCHLILILVFVIFVIPSQLDHLTWFNLFGRDYFGGLILLSGWVFVAFFGGIFITYLLAPLELQITPAGRDPDFNPRKGLKEGGKWIGILERSIIFLLMLINVPSGIGFLITAKTIFRFGEIQRNDNRKEVEYILIGTLLSFFVALLVSLITLMLAQRFLSFPIKLLG
jgi:hypothetical protein